MNNLVTWLMNYALDHNISCIFNKLNADIPSCAIPDKRTIIINTNGDANTLPFTIAHEIAHVLDDDTGILYYQSYSSHMKFEHAANKKAIAILMQYCQENNIALESYIAFAERFGIPGTLFDTVCEELGEYEI